MATDELSSKLSRRLQIEDGTEGPVAVDEAIHNNNQENGGAGELEKSSTANADSELGAKLQRRGELNDGLGDHLQPSMKVFNPYTEFKEFSRKQIKDMERMFKEYDAGKDGFIDLMELKLMMEKLGAPQTHLGLKNMIKEVDEDLDNKLSFREFLMIFRKAAAGELPEDSGLCTLARLSEIDVSTEGVKGAKTFFEAKIVVEEHLMDTYFLDYISVRQPPPPNPQGGAVHQSIKGILVQEVQAINESNRFEAEIREEQDAKKKDAEGRKQRQAAFKELQSAFK